MGNRAPQIQSKAAGETRNVAISFAGMLDSGELLTGTPTIVQLSKSPSSADDLTITNQVVSAAILTINGASVAIGAAVQCTVSGGTADAAYVIKATCGTDASPAQTLEGECKLLVT